MPFGEIILKNAVEMGVDPHLLCSIIYVESSFDETAVSKKGAVGLMQFLPEDEKKWDFHKDPNFSLRSGTEHLKYLIEVFNGDLVLSLMAYNCGIGCAKNEIKIPFESILFAQKVLNLYKNLWLRTPNISFPVDFCKE